MISNKKFRFKCLKCGAVRILEHKSKCPECGGVCFAINPMVITKEK